MVMVEGLVSYRHPCHRRKLLLRKHAKMVPLPSIHPSFLPSIHSFIHQLFGICPVPDTVRYIRQMWSPVLQELRPGNCPRDLPKWGSSPGPSKLVRGDQHLQDAGPLAQTYSLLTHPLMATSLQFQVVRGCPPSQRGC